MVNWNNSKEVKAYMKEYYQDNKDKMQKKSKENYQRPEVKKRIKEYRQKPEVKAKTKERQNKYQKEYYQKNKEREKEQQKEYDQKQEVKKTKKKYYQKNKKTISKNKKEYYSQPEVKKRRNEYRKNRIKTDKNFAIKIRLGKLLSQAFRLYTKTGKIMSSRLYGIDYNAILSHLQPFPEDISKYHIDHIKPLCSFAFVKENGSTNLEEIKKAFAPENHQWLTIQENISKGSKIK